jgi:GNAT superfamily N-acetyltransferase
MEKAKQTASFLLQCLQMFKPYRILARKLIKIKIYYHVATIDSAPELSTFYDFKGFPEIKDPVRTFKKELERMKEEDYFLIARMGKEIAGATVITTFPDDRAYPDWWIFGMSVRTRYRGAGIGEGLVRKAVDMVSEKGATTVNLLVFEHNKAAVSLYCKMGFNPISIPTLDILLEEEVRQGQRRRIIMSKDI